MPPGQGHSICRLIPACSPVLSCAELGWVGMDALSCPRKGSGVWEEASPCLVPDPLKNSTQICR